MSMPIARKLVGFFQDRSPTGSDLENLTQREQEILTLLARGYQYKEIAETAGVKLETVRSHIKHIYDKLHVRSRTEATLKFLGESGREGESR
jgi:DNA-binding NarL/FixJ family response regulator